MSDWKLLCGDCLELMPQFEAGSFDVILTDPPWATFNVDIGWKGPRWWKKVIREFERILGTEGKLILHLGSIIDFRPMTCCIKLPFITINWLRYTPPSYFGKLLYEADIALHFGNAFLPKGHRVLPAMCHMPSIPTERDGRKALVHPMPRSQRHVDWLVKYHVGPGHRILDAFVGSGSTIIAALRHGSDCTGIEINPEYAEEARTRVKGALQGIRMPELKQGQGALYD